MQEYIEYIKELLEEIQPYEDFDEETNLIQTELLDSLSILYLVTQLEEKYKITIEESKIIPENFTNIITIAQLVSGLID